MNANFGSCKHFWFAACVFSFVFSCVGFFGLAPASAETIGVGEFQVAEGFQIKQWATTPQLSNPTNFDIDAKGRMWVTESVNYRQFRNKALGLTNDDGDRIVVLEDTDGDGSADSSHTFVRDPDLVAPLGIGVIDNRVYVSCSPNILIYTDVNRDAKFTAGVDTKEVFLTGFRGLDHDHSLHSVKAGPDGYLYFNVGNGGPHTVTDKAGWTLRAGSSYAGGSPHLKENFPGRKSDDGRVWVGGVGMRVRPDGTGLEPIGHNFRNAYEETVTSFGDVFHSDNDDPPACRTTYVMEYGNAGFSSADGKRGWMADQRPGQPVNIAEWRQEDPGTMPAGDVYGYGAPTGVVFGETGCFDKRYPAGLLLTCESARGQIFAYEPKPQGAGFTLQRNVFLSLKNGSEKTGWFRPSDVGIGPDGAIYVSDWYDPGVGGHRMTDSTGSGTIYRIAPKDYQAKIPSANPSTVNSSVDSAVALLMSPTANVRAVGFAKLKEEGERALGAIKQVIRNSNPLLAVRGVWLLPYAGDPGLEILDEVLEDGNSQMRIAALRALRRASATKQLREKLSGKLDDTLAVLCNDPASSVRREVALTIRDLPWGKRKGLLKHIALRFDGWDRWYLEAIGIAADTNVSDAYELLVGQSGIAPLDWDRRLSSLAWRLRCTESVDAIASRVMSETLPFAERKRMLTALAFVPERNAAEKMLVVSKTGPEDVRGMAAWWGKNRDTNDWKEHKLGSQFPEPPEYKKPKKWATPRLDYQVAGEPAFTAVGDKVSIDIDIQNANRIYLVVERLDQKLIPVPKSPTNPKATITHDSVGASWVDAKLVAGDKTTRLSEIDWLSAFADGQQIPTAKANSDSKTKWDRRIRLSQPVVVNGVIKVRSRSIIAYDLHNSPHQRFIATGLLDAADIAAKNQVQFSVYVDRSQTGDALPPIAKLMDVAGDATHGRALFFSKRLSCSNCHSASAFGGGVGPDLTQIAKKHAPPVLFEGIVDPSAAISTGFETMMVLTSDSKVISGLTVSAGDPVVLKDSEGKTYTIAQADIEEMKSSKVSMMPVLKPLLTAEEIASLVAFLQSMKVN